MVQTTDNNQDDRFPAPLLPDRAFVVQLRAQPGAPDSRFEGQVEHVTSGEVAHFDTPEGLVAFLKRIAGRQDERSR